MPAKKILLINGHPTPGSFNQALLQAYQTGAEGSGFQVETIHLHQLDFNPNLSGGYQLKSQWEPDLENAWNQINACDHMVWVHPVWWGGLPALTKGFIDRVFIPGKAFKYREKSILWDKLLKGKTARILTTLDQPGWYYYLKYGQPSINQLKKSTLEFCGVSPVRVSTFGIIKTSTPKQREQWQNKALELGRKGS